MSDRTIADVIRENREKAYSKIEKAQYFKAVAVDNHGVIIGIGASIGLDRDDETVDKGALIGLAYDFCANKGRTFHPNHDTTTSLDADLVCSWPGQPILKSGKVLEPGAEYSVDDPIVAINIEKGKETHWFVGVKPHDPRILQAAKAGEIAGLSWAGMAQKQEAE